MYPVIIKIIEWFARGGDKSFTNAEIYSLAVQLNDADTLQMMLKMGFIEVRMEYDKKEIAMANSLTAEAQMWLSGNPGNLSLTRAEICLNQRNAILNNLKEKPNYIIKEGTGFCDSIRSAGKERIAEKREQLRKEAEKRQQEEEQREQEERERRRIREEKQRDDEEILKNRINQAINANNFSLARQYASKSHNTSTLYEQITNAQIAYIQRQNRFAEEQCAYENKQLQLNYQRHLENFDKLISIQKALDDLFYVQNVTWSSVDQREMQRSVSRRTETQMANQKQQKFFA